MLRPLLIFLLSIQFIYAQEVKDSLTIKDAVALTIKNYPLIQLAIESINVAEAKIKEQKSNLYPYVEGEASYTAIGPIPYIYFGNEPFDLAVANNYDAHVSLYHTFYDFGKRDALVDLSKSYKRSAIDNVDYVKSNLAFQTVQTFYSIILLERSIAVKDTDIANLNNHLSFTKKRFETGSATDFDVLTTQVRISNAENQKLDLQNVLKKQIILLKKLTDIPYDSTVNLLGDFSLNYNIISKDSLLAVAMQQRPELKLALDSENSAMIQQNAAGLGSMPSLNVMLSYGLKNGYMPNLDAIRGNWVAGVGVSVPIFDGFRTSANEEEAYASLRVSEEHTAKVKKDIVSEIQQAVEDLKIKIDKVSSTKIQVNYAEESIQRANIQYRNGVATNLDLLDAEDSLAQAKLQYLLAVYDAIISNYNLKQSVGDVIW
jgi:outer membrane protein TolC